MIESGVHYCHGAIPHNEPLRSEGEEEGGVAVSQTGAARKGKKAQGTIWP